MRHTGRVGSRALGEAGLGGMAVIALLVPLVALPLCLAPSPGDPCASHEACAPGRCCAGSCAAAGAVCCGDGLCSPLEACRTDDGACTGGLACTAGCSQLADGSPCLTDEACASASCAQDWEGGAGLCAPGTSCAHAGSTGYRSLVDTSGAFYCNATVWMPRRPDGSSCSLLHPIMCSSRRCAEDASGGAHVCCASGCAKAGACAPTGDREGGRYCDGAWKAQLADGEPCTGPAACVNATCVEGLDGGAAVCCQRRCTAAGVCHANGTRLAGLYCAGAWKLQRADGEACDEAWECASARCAADRLTGGGVCCATSCAHNATCNAVAGRAGGLFCNASGAWEPQREDGAGCQQDHQCRGGSCRALGNASVCCTIPRCAAEGSCLPEGTRQEDRYCSNGTWRSLAASECQKDYECRSNRCTDDADGAGRFCCATGCVDNGTCHQLHGRSGSRYCNGTGWSWTRLDGEACAHSSACTSEWCVADLSGSYRCAPHGTCVQGSAFYPSGRSAAVGGGTRFCLEGSWHECGRDLDCGAGRWCDEGLVCRSPSCGNGRCEGGECTAGCRDCTLASCVGDGACTASLGEGCWSSGDCPCAAGLRCRPSDPRRDGRGCVSSRCGDGTCSPSDGECTAGCGSDCNATACSADGACTLAVGEDCSTSPDCTCPEGALCRPGEAGADPRGCSSLACGNGVCDIDRGECATGCRDCSAAACAGDGACTPALGEGCSTSRDCTCAPPLACRPAAHGADPAGCAPPLCGDGACEGDEGCESCPRDCGTCFALVPDRVTLTAGPGEDAELPITITTRSRTAYFVAVVEPNITVPLLVDPPRVLVQPGSSPMVVATLKGGDARPAAGSILLRRGSTGEVLASLAVTVDSTGGPRLRLVQGLLRMAALAGSAAPFYLPVVNDGTDAVTASLALAGDDEAVGWTTLDAGSLQLPPGVQRMASGRVLVPANATPGVRELRILVDGGVARAEAVLEVTVRERAAGACGDGACGAGEDCGSCPGDCPCAPALELVLPFEGLVNASEGGRFPVEVANRGSAPCEGCSLRLVGAAGAVSPDNATIPAGGSARFEVALDTAVLANVRSFSLEALAAGRVAAARNLTVSAPPAAGGREELSARAERLAGRLEAASLSIERARLEGRDADLLRERATSLEEELASVRRDLDSGRLTAARQRLDEAADELDGLLASLDSAGLPSSPPAASPSETAGTGGRTVSWGGALLLAAALLPVALGVAYLLRWSPPPPSAPPGGMYRPPVYRPGAPY